jgi:hypothetical protein
LDLKEQLLRIVSGLLVLSLLGDPVTASSLAQIGSPECPPAALQVRHSVRATRRVQEEALALAAIPYLSRLLRPIPHHAGRLAIWMTSKDREERITTSSGGRLVLRLLWAVLLTPLMWAITRGTWRQAWVISKRKTSRSWFAFYVAPALEVPIFITTYTGLFPHFGWWPSIIIGSLAISMAHDIGPYTAKSFFIWFPIRAFGAALINSASLWPLYHLYTLFTPDISFWSLLHFVFWRVWSWAILVNYAPHVPWNRKMPPPGRLALVPSELTKSVVHWPRVMLAPNGSPVVHGIELKRSA